MGRELSAGRPPEAFGDLESVQAATVLRCEVGSTLHGIAVGGLDDVDEMGICVEPKTHVLGLGRFEQLVWRTQPEGVRSGPGDLDLVIYGLRKWCRLALNGNPTILLPLFAPPEFTRRLTWAGALLRDQAWAFASRRAGKAYLGYMQQQRQRLAGERGQKSVSRPELVARYGYDTKYASHIMRLGLQGIEYLQTGRLTLPMPEAERRLCQDIRTGRYSEAEALAMAEECEQSLRDALRSSLLPEEPDHRAVDWMLAHIYQIHWGAGDLGMTTSDVQISH